jgi:serine/threonine-protein kinase
MHGLEGKTLGKYRVIEQLGRGGMAIVYKAYHPELDRYVAIKVLQSFLIEGEDFLTRFSREAKTVANLRHPNIVQIHDFDVEGDLPFMVMEYIEGKTLKARLSELSPEQERLPLDETLRIFRQIASALHYAHRKGLYHRDVKPANILIDTEEHVYLADFGIARIVSDTAFTASGAFLGTPSYIAPEQAMGESITRACDIYSLGVVLYELVTGKVPFDADTPLAVIQQHISAPLPMPSSLRSDIPEALERVILRALAKEPGDRYTSAAEMLEAVEEAIGLEAPMQPGELHKAPAQNTDVVGEAVPMVQETSSADAPTMAPPRRWLRKATPVLAIAGVLIALLIYLGATTLTGPTPGTGDQPATSPPTEAMAQIASPVPARPTAPPATKEPSPALLAGPYTTRLRLTTKSDWTSLRLVSGGNWADPQIVQLSEEGEISLETDGTILLRQPCALERDCKEIEAILDLALVDVVPGGQLVIGIDRGHWGWTEWELMNALGPEPIGVVSDEYRSIVPGGVREVVSSASLLEKLVAFVHLGHQVQGDGLRLRLSEADGLHKSVEIEGFEARQTIPMQAGQPGSYLYFGVDDDFYFDSPQNIEVLIEYFDNGDEWIGLNYDALPAGSPENPRGYTGVDLVQREDSQTWKTASVVVGDATFAGHQHGVWDFRLATGLTPLTVRYVEIRKLP